MRRKDPTITVPGTEEHNCIPGFLKMPPSQLGAPHVTLLVAMILYNVTLVFWSETVVVLLFYS